MFKRIISSFTFLHIIAFSLSAQSVGIGVTSPTQTLDLNGSFRLRHTSNATAGTWFDGNLLPVRTFIGTYSDDQFGFWGNDGAGWGLTINNLNNNVGLGIAIPQSRLDINGNLRIRNSSNTAGIWFDGNLLPTRSFIGTVNEQYFGIWGNGGTGWNINFDVTNGNLGIGTPSPTRKLDLNGTLRIRNNSPVKGSVLTCKDADGNTEWVNPSIFKANKTLNNTYTPIPNGTWTKVLFNTNYVYNQGLNYDANNSNFIVPVDGIYSLHTLIAFYNTATIKQSIRLVLNRNGIISTVAENFDQGYGVGTIEYVKGNYINTDAHFLAGDIIWVEVFSLESDGSDNLLDTDESKTWFSGNLVAKL